ncbi:MAG: heme-copper oxidase subunit III [Oscillatoriales cyanobacterium RM2_1_1]|nr:heme-copper oxidase subunit III [Oscillatoriales cyanobacterium SM2_3_0]NJO45885.1 heme-copper oxidase subunit III [Oscillatoriales cyanobacterium RM2_1_1]
MQSSALNDSQTVPGYQAVAADSHHDHAEEHPDLRMTGVLVFLVAESMIFLGLFTAYLIYRSSAEVWPPVEIERELLLPGINTLILISSSFVMNRGAVAIKKNDAGGLQFWFLLTALMGIVFLSGQVYEYMGLDFGLTTNLYASSFYVLTAFHGMHVTFGVILILAVLWRNRQPGHYSKEYHFGPEAAELYWHFVDVIWIILFILLYLL